MGSLSRPKVLALAGVCVVVIAAVVATIVLTSSGSGDAAEDAPPTATVAAGRLRGKWGASRYGRRFAAFEGVPYAKPPVGPLRFEPPQPIEPWTEELKTQQHGDMCPQRDLDNATNVVGNEDCLYLNVYAPETVDREEPLPVMLFVHGGGFAQGSGFMYGPEYIMDRDVVYVNFNYRLGALGFLSTGDDIVSGNFGNKDQALVVRWVQDNIRAFGGNPDRVLLFGESAGSISAQLLNASPLSRGLFHRLLAQSAGVPPNGQQLRSREQAWDQAHLLAQAAGCPVDTSENLKKCLQELKPASQFVELDKTAGKFWPVVEAEHPGAFVTEQPSELYKKKVPIDLPVIIGFVSNEGCYFGAALCEDPEQLKELDENFLEMAPVLTIGRHNASDESERNFFEKVRKFYFGDDPITRNNRMQVIQMLSDSKMFLPTLETVAVLKSTFTSHVFLYEMEHIANRSWSVKFGAKHADYGMCHVDDLLYLFPLRDVVPGEVTPEDEAFSNKLLDFFVNFAVTGRPSEDGSWQAVEHGGNAEYMYLTSATDYEMRNNFEPENMKLWREQL